ncbi:hypothetical protein FKW77_000560 [Venturia effusa]|uniref:Nudix hydrolase domain-containing protein n=1 Tax=Venturia effusa TaxID=50376 RepID=A0A517LPD6_9PEZI|nr:hypothetical protein FKW77_000560 [Venturia effusa]
MAILKPAHAAAIARLRSYVPPPTRYYSLPLSRRAAVLVLLYGGQQGELRVLLTMRARGLNAYGGHSSFPGGRADDLCETPFQTARREAHEEIGLSRDDSRIPPPFRIEHLCQLPANLARTELGVRPCIAHLYPDPTSSSAVTPSVEEAIIPQLDAREVAAVFTAPFRSFLKQSHGLDHVSENAEGYGVETTASPAQFYRGAWTDWHEARWRMHSFYIPVRDQVVTWSTQGLMANGADKEPAEHKLTAQGDMERFRVFGMTARILVDAARLAFAEEPEFEHNAAFGDEDMIGRLLKVGRLSQVRRKSDELTKEDMVAAAKL